MTDSFNHASENYALNIPVSNNNKLTGGDFCTTDFTRQNS